MAQLTLDIVSQKAITLGFKLTLLGPARYRIMMAGTSYGYQGNLEGCMAYLQGWEENSKFSLNRW